jgi:hypothetical protein
MNRHRLKSKRWYRRNRHTNPALVKAWKICQWDFEYFSQYHFPVHLSAFKVEPESTVFIDGFTSMSYFELKYFLKRDRDKFTPLDSLMVK